MNSKRWFQIVLAVASLLPLVTGFTAAFFGINGQAAVFGYDKPITGDDPTLVFIDFAFRFASGLWFALVFQIWYLIPRFETETTWLRFIVLSIFVGGFARATSAMVFGIPDLPGARYFYVIAFVVELLLVPLLAVWQARLVRSRS